MKILTLNQFNEKIVFQKRKISDIKNLGDEIIDDTIKESEPITVYFPILYTDDGTNIDYVTPSELGERRFYTEDDAADWMRNKGYDEDEFTIDNESAYRDEYTIIDADENIIEN